MYVGVGWGVCVCVCVCVGEVCMWVWGGVCVGVWWVWGGNG